VSRETLFDRLVTLELSTAGGENGRGNEVRTTSTIDGIPAHRSQSAATEDTADRDQQARTFVYLFPIFAVQDGEVIDVADVLTGRDRILDGNDTLKILGTPVVATSRGRRLHVKARAFVLEG
jgi:hypothetical protein